MLSLPLEEPELKFRPWVLWSNRSDLVDPPDDCEDGSDYPGLYILGHFKSAPHPSSPAIASGKQTVYIGQTKNIRNRPIRCHNKRTLYSEKYADWSLRHLYVAIWDIAQWFDVSEPQKAFLAYAEKKLIWEYARRWGCRPPLNLR